jgi:uncharacterized OB-fold protein
VTTARPAPTDEAGHAEQAGRGERAGRGEQPVRTRLEPPVGAESGPFWDATREGRLLVQWCVRCDRGIFYPRAFCPYCGGAGDGDGDGDGDGEVGGPLEWREASGRATVHAAVVEYRPEAAGATFSDGAPYCIALVDLEEGVRMMTNIVDCRPEDVHSGMAVTVAWEPLSDGRRLALFRPTGEKT